MAHSEGLSIVIGGIGVGLIAITTIPSVKALVKNVNQNKRQCYPQIGIIYEDKDGRPTEEAAAAYSDTVQKTLVYSFTVLGFITCTTSAVLSTVEIPSPLLVENWLQFYCFVLLIVQAISLSLERSCVERFTLGIYGAISSLAQIITSCLMNGLFLFRVGFPGLSPVHKGLSATQFLATASILCAYISLPRRPDVFKDGKMVDRQYTVSAFRRYVFAWPEHVLDFATKKRTVELKDLPRMDHLTRSENLREQFDNMSRKGRLWQQLYFAHSAAFVGQWVLTLLQAIILFVPQFAMYQILTTLERRQSGEFVGYDAWIWVFALCTGLILNCWVSSWMDWVSLAQLGVRIEAQLSALIFSKAMQRKDVRGVQKAMLQKAQNIDTLSEISLESGPTGGDAIPADALLKTRQSTINLIGIDAERVAEFASHNNNFHGNLFKLIISLVFLISLVGWKSLLAGLAVLTILAPLNMYNSKNYSDAQDRLMKVRDEKMGVVTEALQGIRQIKFTALERQWESKIGSVRTRELHELWNVCKYDVGLIFCWDAIPTLMTAVALATYAILNQELTPSVAFTTLGVFSELEGTLSKVPELTTDLLDAYVSVKRIEEYLKAPERPDDLDQGESVTFKNASIAWPSDEDEEGDGYILRNINLKFPENKLSVISGKTGSGKSLLLASILGEADLLSGTIEVPKSPPICDRRDDKATRDNWIIQSSIAFVAQSPWIENATIKDNILFGLPFNSVRYQKVLNACALQHDLRMLVDGELTEIGANGINLSGGQRWRVSFARALYSRAGILVLDDIFSAVDAQVGRQILEQGLTGELGQGRTRILATHHVALCIPKTDYSVQLGDGTIEYAGFVEELERIGSLQKILSHEPPALVKEDKEATAETVECVGSSASGVSHMDGSDHERRPENHPKKFVEEEARKTGKVEWDVYLEYLKSSGGLAFWVLAASALCASEVLVVGRSWWLKLWTEGYEMETALLHTNVRESWLQSMPGHNVTADPQHKVWYYLSIYLGLSVAMTLIRSFSHLWIWRGSIRASKILSERLTFTVLRAPLRWLDTVPVGRVLNRFTADFATFDSNLGDDLAYLILYILEVMGIVAAAIFVSPYIVILALILFGVCVHFAFRSLRAAQEVRRLMSEARSPIFEQFGSALTGLGTIRAFGKAEFYVQRMCSLIDGHTSAYYYVILFNRWMALRTGMVDAVFGTIVAIIIVSVKGIDASLAGFTLGFMLNCANTVIWAIRQYTETELDMNSAERIIEYVRLPVEDQTGQDVPAAWPSEGRLEVSNLVVGYATDLPAVLRGLTFTVERNQRVGIIGRTGAGKSSLTLSLFRFLEAREGAIYIDGLDISQIKLHDLRSRLAIIPQDPVLFSGTVRSNLDAFNEHTDDELRDALERVHLVHSTMSLDEYADAAAAADTNVNIFNSLSSPISEGGLNLSQGQRQLLCLARAIISRPKIMVLDEATSAVDKDTDALIQRSIRKEFTDSTLLVIAHRLSTIADFDRILVMSEGQAVEFGAPMDLMREQGAFWKMVRESGEGARLELLLSAVSGS